MEQEVGVDVAVTRGQRAATGAAGLAWSLPLGALALLGLSEKASFLVASPRALVTMAMAASAAGVSLGVAALLGSLRAGGAPGTTRRALVALVASAVVLLVAGVASVCGAASGREAQVDLRLVTEAAVRDFPGWNGGAVLDGARVVAAELGAGSEAVRLVVRQYGQPLGVLLLSVDNRGGQHDVVLDLDSVRLHGAGVRPGLSRSDVLARVASDRRAALAAELAPVRVPVGTTFAGGLAFFAPSESFRDVRSIEVRVDGAWRAVPGRFFTLEEKRAIDAAPRR